MLAKLSGRVAWLLFAFLPLISLAIAATAEVQLKDYSFTNNVDFSGSIYVDVGSSTQTVQVQYWTMYSSAGSITAKFDLTINSTYTLWTFSYSLPRLGIDYFYITYDYGSTTYTDDNGGKNYTILPSLPIPANEINLESWDYAGGVLNGTIYLENLAYNKQLTVYYAVGGTWSSTNSISGSYVGPISGSNYEIWSFSSLVGSGVTSFYVQVAEGGSTYYDNNGGANFTVTVGTYTVTTHPSPSIPQTPTVLPTVPVQLASFTYANYTLSGQISIKNIAYTKIVTVFYSTYDGVWVPGNSIPAGYLQSIPNSDYETWTFASQVGENGIKEFFIQYYVSGDTYYDNNGRKNYKVTDGQPRNETGCLGYKVTHTSKKQETTTLYLSLIGNGCAIYGPDVKDLTVTITSYSANTVRVKIADTAAKLWQIPTNVVPEGTSHGEIKHPTYRVTFTSSPFTFKVIRNTGEVIFDSNVSSAPSLIFEDQFLQINSKLPINANIYGIGDAVDSFRRPPNTTVQTIWARDHATPVRQNQYGSHPIYYELRAGKTHAVYLRNSNGMDVGLEAGKVWYRVIGGVFDFYFFLGPSPAEAAQQYFDIIGRPQFIPRWSIGFHQCRYGWRNIAEVKGVYQNLIAAGIPLDTMWGDIDYMDQFKDFTYDSYNFSGLPQFVDSLHANNQHYVIIVDPGIANVNSYAPYTNGLKKGVFIKNANGSYFVGTVWPGTTVYPDWYHPDVFSWWTESISTFRKVLDFDGLWIDMNEASNFVTPGDSTQPAYHINNDNSQDPLDTNTLSVNAMHYGNITEYNTHNLFGHMEGIHTHAALIVSRPNQRPFILSRSTAASSGRFVNNWLGDNHATYDDIYYSITGVLGMNLYGIPHSGSDICGFIGTSTEDLCNRWAQVGAFYPFSRHHKAIGELDSYFYLWPSVTQSAKTALTIRYTLLPYLYTLFSQASHLGNTVMRPLWWEFPSDTKTYDIDRQFLLGEGLLISPVLTEDTTSVKAYFPAGNWYSWYTGAVASTNAQTLTLSAPQTFVPVHVRGGTILPAQHPNATTYLTNHNDYFLIVPLDNEHQANGILYADDGISINAPSTTVIFSATSNSVSGRLFRPRYKIVPELSEVRVWGLTTKTAPHKVTMNRKNVVGASVNYNATTSVLTIKGLKIDLNEQFILTWA